jgi:hypothetical protein
MEKTQKARYTIDKGRKVTRQNALYPPACNAASVSESTNVKPTKEDEG